MENIVEFGNVIVYYLTRTLKYQILEVFQMDVLIGLYKKELKLLKNTFIGVLIATGVIFIIGVVAANWSQQFGLFYFLSFSLFGFHAFYIIWFMLQSLQFEVRYGQWLHNPHSGSMLLLGKLLASSTYFLISLTLNTIILLILLPYMIEVVPVPQVGELLLVILDIVIGSILLGIFATFLWTVYYSISAPTWVRTIFLLLIIFSLQVAYNLILQIPAFSSTSVKVMGYTDMFYIRFTPTNPVLMFFYILLTLIAFFLSAKLLERKVEV